MKEHSRLGAPHGSSGHTVRRERTGPLEDQQDPRVPKASAGVSQFIAKVLEQLSLTSWLPAAMLVGAGSLLVQIYQQMRQPSFEGPYVDVPAALNSLATLPLGAIVIMVFSLVLVTMITQAFSFQAIRLLEGYWSPKPPFSFALAACVRWQLHRRNKLEERCKKLNEKAFESAKMRLVQSQKQDFINTWEADLYGLSMDQRACTDLSIIKIARSIPWREEADPGLVAVWERCENRLESFPGSNRRLLPTRLGNTLRASEDKLGRQGRALEGFVMQNYQNIPARLMVQHDQFRDRLDMYSSLVLVFTILALGAPFLLSGNLAEGSWVNSVGGSLVFLALAYSSYRAAISSADGYGSILLAISTYLPSPEDD